MHEFPKYPQVCVTSHWNYLWAWTDLEQTQLDTWVEEFELFLGPQKNILNPQKILTFLMAISRWQIRQALVKVASYTSLYILSYTSASNKNLM